MLLEVLLPLALQAASAAPLPAVPAGREIARGVYLIPGSLYEDRSPDGNTVIFDAPRGLVVVDTGRHQWYSDAILAYAQQRDRPIAAIVNTHWHLDHSSGNRRIAAVFPGAPVYTTDAIARTLVEGGFLARSAANVRQRVNNPDLTPVQRYETQNSLATFDNAEHLYPDRRIERSRRMRLAGRAFDVHVTDHAVTDADVWLYDRRNRIAVIGDLVTLPTPFFETACPNAWRRALDEVWAVPFETVIPGHGEPMTRSEFDTYRRAFNAFVACLQSDAQPNACGVLWADGVASLPAGATREELIEGGEYYVGFLRPNGGKAATCLRD